MAPENLDSILRRVQKLLAIAQDERANVNEAAAAAKMAEGIMRKYQLDHSDVIMTSLKTGDDIIHSDHTAYYDTNVPADHIAKTIPSWAAQIAAMLAPWLDCGARITQTAQGKRVRFYGMRQDVMLCGWMYEYLLGIVRSQCRIFLKANKDATKNGLVASFRRGITSGINAELGRMTAEKEAEQAKATESTGRDLVVMKWDAIVKKYGAFEYGQTKVSHRDATAFEKGRVAGRKVDFNVRGVGTTASPTTRLIGK